MNASLRPLVFLLVSALFFAFAQERSIAATPRVLKGIVTDPRETPVAGARVVVTVGGSIHASVTDVDGLFVVDWLETGELTLVVEVKGFLRAERRITGEAESLQITVVLLPAAVSEEVIVTATRTPARLSETATSVVVLTSEALSAAAAETIDDALRQVPGFSLFRRTGSRTANPTSQGVSLRGVGASGASRAVVLDDGIPLNDPFGGWIYWGRVPRASVDRLEVMRGGGSDLYGSGALGGVVNLVRRTAEPPQFSVEASDGLQRTPDLSLFAGKRQGPWGGRVAAELFRTDGYILIGERERGSVDTPAGSRHSTADLTVERWLGEKGRLFLRGSYFEESRRNGTPLQRNDTRIWQFGGGADWQSSAGSFSLHAYRNDQSFHQSFSAVAANRASERLTGLQSVPADAVGLTAEWRRPLGRAHTVVGGIELNQVSGSSDEQSFSQNTTSFVTATGRQRNAAVFAEGLLHFSPRLSATAALRIDHWRNDNGRRSIRSDADADGTAIRFRDRTETAVSPRASFRYAWTDQLSLGASAYRAFRTPTLNELYRSFRVGNVMTLSNENLDAERLTGAEGALFFSSPRLTARGTVFWMEIERPVTNVTLAVAPDLITRQRQNLGHTRSRGIEIESEAHVGGRWSVSGGYLFADSTVTSSPANPDLEGRRIPQVPRHHATLQLRYANPAVATVGLQGRLIGAQFDDDQNRLRLGSFFALDALVSRRISGGLEAFVAVENLFDERYEVGRTPIKTLGPPRFMRFGFRCLLPL